MNWVLLSFDTPQNPENPEENQLLNPSSPNIHKKILYTDIYTFLEELCWKILFKDQHISLYGDHFINSHNLLLIM